MLFRYLKNIFKISLISFIKLMNEIMKIFSWSKKFYYCSKIHHVLLFQGEPYDLYIIIKSQVLRFSTTFNLYWRLILSTSPVSTYFEVFTGRHEGDVSLSITICGVKLI